MRYAVHKWLKKTFDADDAPPGDSYCCPVCSAPVTLRARGERVAYFAHKAGTGTRDCELYHLGSSIAYAHLINQPQASSQWEFKLGVQISASGYPHAWGLELSVPMKEGVVGEIEVDVGGRSQKILLSGETGKVKRITAEPQSEDYLVVTAKFANSLFASALTRTCAALDDRRATVFGDASKRHEVTIPRASRLNYNGRYVFVWGGNMSPIIPDELSVEFLQSRQGWRAAILDIPPEVSRECAQWLIEFTGLDLVAAIPSLIPVWPPLVRRIGPQLSQVPHGSSIHLYAKGLPATNSVQSVVYARSGRKDVAVNVDATHNPFLLVSPETETCLQVSCRDNPNLRIELDFNCEQVSISSLPFVTLVGESIYGFTTTVQLHDLSALAWLRSVATGEVALKALRVPQECTGFLRTGRHGAWTTEFKVYRREGDRSFGGIAALESCVSHIASALRDHSLDTQLDFGGFGRSTVRAQARQDTCAPLVIDKFLRARIKAYLAQLPRPKYLQHCSLQVTDQELVDLVSKALPTSQAAAVHRTLLSELGSVIRKREGD